MGKEENQYNNELAKLLLQALKLDSTRIFWETDKCLQELATCVWNVSPPKGIEFSTLVDHMDN